MPVSSHSPLVDMYSSDNEVSSMLLVNDRILPPVQRQETGNGNLSWLTQLNMDMCTLSSRTLLVNMDMSVLT